MAKKSGTKSLATKVKDLPVKDAKTVKGGNNLGPTNIQKKTISSTTTSTTA